MTRFKDARLETGILSTDLCCAPNLQHDTGEAFKAGTVSSHAFTFHLAHQHFLQAGL